MDFLHFDRHRQYFARATRTMMCDSGDRYALGEHRCGLPADILCGGAATVDDALVVRRRGFCSTVRWYWAQSRGDIRARSYTDTERKTPRRGGLTSAVGRGIMQWDGRMRPTRCPAFSSLYLLFLLYNHRRFGEEKGVLGAFCPCALHFWV